VENKDDDEEEEEKVDSFKKTELEDKSWLNDDNVAWSDNKRSGRALDN
jgi:hypothetical protein